MQVDRAGVPFVAVDSDPVDGRRRDREYDVARDLGGGSSLLATSVRLPDRAPGVDAEEGVERALRVDRVLARGGRGPRVPDRGAGG